MKRFALTAAAVCAATMAGAVIGAPEDDVPGQGRGKILSTEITGSDLGFFTGAARQTALVLEVASLAKTHATTPEVRALAAATWKEQSDNSARLKDLAASKQVPLPEEPDGQGKKLLQTLAKLKGVKFDKACLEAFSDTQDQLETSLQAGAASTDRAIKAFAETGLGVLKPERERVKKLGI